MSLNNVSFKNTFTCSGYKEVDLDALNMLASGGCDNLCACTYRQERGHHHFVYDTAMLTPFVHIRAGMTFEEAIELLRAGLETICMVQTQGLIVDNLRVTKEYIFHGPEGYRFLYIPILRKQHARIKEMLLKLIAAVPFKDARLTELTRALRRAKSDEQAVALAEKFVNSFLPAGNSEEETSLLNHAAAEVPMAEDGETTLLGQQRSQAAGAEPETTMLSELRAEESAEESLSTVYSGITSERLTAFLQNTQEECETTLLSAQPQPAQQTIISGYGSMVLYLLRNSTGEKILVEVTPFSIGKDRHLVDYAVDNDSVSRQHATIVFEEGTYYIVDNGSTNGTMIEGIKLQAFEKAELGNGYFISIGNESFQTVLERR